MDAVDNMGFDFIASGHYAKVIHPSTGDQPSHLVLSADVVRILIFMFLSRL